MSAVLHCCCERRQFSADQELKLAGGDRQHPASQNEIFGIVPPKLVDMQLEVLSVLDTGHARGGTPYRVQEARLDPDGFAQCGATDHQVQQNLVALRPIAQCRRLCAPIDDRAVSPWSKTSRLR